MNWRYVSSNAAALIVIAPLVPAIRPQYFDLGARQFRRCRDAGTDDFRHPRRNRIQPHMPATRAERFPLDLKQEDSQSGGLGQLGAIIDSFWRAGNAEDLFG